VAVGQVENGAWDAAPSGAGLAVARAVLRATAQIEHRPSRVLAALNRALLAGSERDRRSVSAIYASVRPARARTRVRICAAGLNSAFVRRADGRVAAVVRSGAALGERPDPQLRDTRLLLRPGDSLILVTSGVIHALTGRGEADGDAGLRRVLGDLGAASAARCTDTILREVRKAYGGRPDHEIVALVLKVPSRRRGSGTHSGGWTGTRRYSPSLYGERAAVPDGRKIVAVSVRIAGSQDPVNASRTALTSRAYACASESARPEP